MNDWTPILDGDVYCSPACGNKCKKSDYDAATLQAEKLAAELGVGWSYKIWEDNGWHIEIKKGCCSIIPSVDKTQYAAFINSIIQVVKHGKTCREALDEAKAELKRRVDKILHDLSDL